jgi:PhnB protein
MARRFDALSAGGKITIPLQDTFWGAKFGMVTDVHGVSWMFNCQTKQP